MASWSMRMQAALFIAALSANCATGQCEPSWSGLGAGASWEVRSLAAFVDRAPEPLSPSLFAAGGFGVFGGVSSPMVARWDGWAPSALGAGLTTRIEGLRSVAVVPVSTGKLAAGVYAGGDITTAGGEPVNNIARWDGSAWHDVGGGLTASVFVLVAAMAIFDEDGEGPLPPALFVGGRFQFAGGVPVAGIARWDGKQWSEVGGGVATIVSYPKVNAMTVYDDGRGPALYVAGSFDRAGTETAYNIARWDGTRWESVGGGLSTTAESICVFDEDGPGPKRPALFVGGQFNWAGGGTVRTVRIARWDGSGWSDVGGWSSSGAVLDMVVWDRDGAGPEQESLYIGGFFNRLPDGTLCNQLARWDGENWHTVGGGISADSGIGPAVRALAVFDEDGPGPNPGGLYVGGLFSHAGGVPAKNIARWGCPLPPSPPCYADCDGDGELTFFDFLCFQNLFAAMDPGADCDGDTELTFFDFLCFQNAFAAGCP